MPPADDKIKLRPVDKVIGAFTTTGVLAGLGAAMWWILPILIPLVAGTVLLAVGAVALFGILFVVSDKSTRGLISRMYRLAIQRIGLAVIRFDPIAALRDHISQLHKRAEEFTAHRSTLRGITRNLGETVQKISAERDDFLSQASTARALGDQRAMSKLAAFAERRRESFEYLDGQLQQLTQVEDVLGKLAQEANDVVEDCEDELDQLVLRDKASSAASSALSSALDILGDHEMDAAKKEAVSIIEERVGRRLADIDMAMDKTTGLISGIDVKTATVDKKALAAVLEYEKRQPTAERERKTTARRAAAVDQKQL